MGDREPLDIIEDAIRTGNGIPLTPHETAKMVVDHLACNGLHVAPIAMAAKSRLLDLLRTEQVNHLGEADMTAIFGTVGQFLAAAAGGEGEG